MNTTAFPNQLLLTLTFLFAGIMVLFLVLNGVYSAKKGESSRLYMRLMHLSGIAATICNGIRVLLIYDDSRGVMLTANIVVLFTLAVSLYRSEHGQPNYEDEEEDA